MSATTHESLVIDGLHVDTKGGRDQKPVIMLHGFLGSSRNLWRLSDRVAQAGFFSISYDQRGHGHSSWLKEYSLEALAHDVTTILDHFRIPEALIIGHSMGGRVSLAATGLYPSRFSALALLDVGPTINQQAYQNIQNIILPLPPEYENKKQAEDSLAHHSPAMKAFLLANLRSKGSHEPLHWVFDLEGLKNSMLQGIVLDQTQILAERQKPTLILRGDRSDHFTAPELERANKLNPLIKTQTIENAGHWIHADNLDGVCQALIPWLKSMAMIIVLLTSVLTFGPLALAQPKSQCADFTLTRHPNNGDTPGDLILHPPRALHFNVKAPVQGLAVLSPQKSVPLVVKQLMPQTIHFAVPKEIQQVRVSAFLCDDAKTKCEEHVVTQDLAAIPLQTPASSTSIQPQSLIKSIDNHRSHGTNRRSTGAWTFHVDDYKKAFELAKASHRKILLDFFAIWCPPCNRLDNEVFSSPEFLKVTKNWVTLKVDVDSPEAWDLKARYQVKGYPTVVMASSEGDVLTRFEGYISRPSFFKLFQQIDQGNSPAGSIAEEESEGDRLQAQALAHAEKGETAAAQELFLKAADAYLQDFKTLSTEQQSKDRALRLERAYCLAHGAQVPQAMALYQELQKKWPREFTFYYAQARAHLDLKNFDQAQALAQKALPLSYGDNRLRTTMVLAQAYLGLNQKEKGRSLLQTTLKTTLLPTHIETRTHRYIKQMQELLASFN